MSSQHPEDPVLVFCKGDGCSALRAMHVLVCFCGETAYRVAPPLKDPSDKLFEDEKK